MASSSGIWASSVIKSDLGFVSEGSHLPDFTVTNVRSERKDYDVVCTWCKVWHINGSAIAWSLTWRSSHWAQVAIFKCVNVILWSIFVFATCWEKSCWILDTLKDYILCLGINECKHFIWLMSRCEFRCLTLNAVDDPVLIIVSIVGWSVIGSPLTKWCPEFTLISVRKISLCFPFCSPEGARFRPWTGVFWVSPWVSHFDKLINTCTISSETKSIENSISMASNKVVMAYFASCSHRVLIFGTFGYDCPELIISHLVGLMWRDWHTSYCS